MGAAPVCSTITPQSVLQRDDWNRSSRVKRREGRLAQIANSETNASRLEVIYSNDWILQQINKSDRIKEKRRTAYATWRYLRSRSKPGGKPSRERTTTWARKRKRKGRSLLNQTARMNAARRSIEICKETRRTDRQEDGMKRKEKRIGTKGK